MRAVQAWLLAGHTVDDIIEAAAEKYPGQDVGAAMSAVVGHFETVGRADAGVLRGWCLEAIRDQYQRLVATGDFPNALRAVKMMEQIGCRRAGED